MTALKLAVIDQSKLKNVKVEKNPTGVPETVAFYKEKVLNWY